MTKESDRISELEWEAEYARRALTALARERDDLTNANAALHEQLTAAEGRDEERVSYARTLARERDEAREQVAQSREALLKVHTYFMRCGQAWADGDGKIVNEEGFALASAEGLDELCNEAADAVAAALGVTEQSLLAEVREMRAALAKAKGE